MNAVTVTEKFQVAIPQVIREQLHLVAGQQMQVIAYDNRIELIPLSPPASLRGFIEGLDTSVPREADRA